jgi:hypothetical protein
MLNNESIVFVFYDKKDIVIDTTDTDIIYAVSRYPSR